MTTTPNRRHNKGFTLIELLIVMTIIGILATISIPSYQRSVIRARETVLLENLYQTRRAIDSYFADKFKYPESLDELVTARYLRDLPFDPFTSKNNSWETVPPEPTDDGQLAEGGVADLHSGSELVGLNGKPYREW